MRTSIYIIRKLFCHFESWLFIGSQLLFDIQFHQHISSLTNWLLTCHCEWACMKNHLSVKNHEIGVFMYSLNFQFWTLSQNWNQMERYPLYQSNHHLYLILIETISHNHCNMFLDIDLVCRSTVALIIRSSSGNWFITI